MLTRKTISLATLAAALLPAVTLAGQITELIGPDGDGLGNTLGYPWNVTTDRFGNTFVSGVLSDTVFRIDRERKITLVLDSDGDHAGNEARLPKGLDTDASGNLYVACAHGAFRVTPDGVSTLVRRQTLSFEDPTDARRR